MWVEVVAALVLGLVAGQVGTDRSWSVVPALGVWVISAYHRGSAVLSPARGQIRALVDSAAMALAAVSLAVGLRLVDAQATVDCAVAVGAATVVAVAARLVRRSIHGGVRTLVVGDRVAASELSASWRRTSQVDVVAVCVVEPDLGDEDQPQEVMGAPAIGPLHNVASAVEEYGVDSVIVAPGPGFTSTDFRRLAWSVESSSASLGVVGVLASVAPHRVAAGTLGGILIADVYPPRQSRCVRWSKTVVDRVLGGLLTVLLAPLLTMLWLLVRLDSPGPGLFRQQRVGENGEPFTMYKLRTMQTDAEVAKAQLRENNDGNGLLFKMRQDPRVTRVGQLLRRSSLDELPQLINVAKGEMSLVGPRPALPEEVARYDTDVRRRLAVKPGLTGLWQVSGRSDLPWDEAVRLDISYVDNWRLGADLMIVARTANAVVRSRGAY